MLIGYCLSSIPMYIIGLYILPQGVHKSADKDLSRFFLQAANEWWKYHMVK